jgi:hypothetical protein
LNHQAAVDELCKGVGKEYDAQVIRVINEVGLNNPSHTQELSAIPTAPELITCSVS